MRALEKACPLLVPLVEEGWTGHPVTAQVIDVYLEELRAQAREEGMRYDTLVLGCTHYPLLRPMLQQLNIMRDSRVGSFGALAIVLAILARFVFLSNIPPHQLDNYLVAGPVACRWTALPLAYFLPPAREQSGQGARVAGKITTLALAAGTLLTLIIVGLALGRKALWVGLAALAMTAASGAYYRRRIGGVTGDCLGATNQLTEVAIYFAGVVLR